MEKSYFLQRRSVRKFSGKEVSDQLLAGVLEEAMRAPTTGNMQLYSVVVTREKEMKDRLDALHFSQPAATGAPVILTVCADLHRFTRWCEVSGADPCFDNFLSFLSAFADAIIYCQQVVTVAEMKGLGTCYLGTVTYNAPEIAELLELPRLTIPVGAIAIGWPAEEGVPTERLGIEAVIHKEKYEPLADGKIREIFRVKEEYEPNRKFVEENGKKNLAQVFSEIRYPRQSNEAISEKYLAYLKNTGILK